MPFRSPRALVSVLLLALAACSGGGSSGPPVPITGPSPTPAPPTATPTPAPPTVSTASATVSTTAPTTVALPVTASGLSATVSFPAASSAAQLALGLSAGPPPSTPVLQSVRRLPAALGTAVSPLAYLTLQSSADVSFGTTLALTLTLPTTPAGNAYLALFDPTNPSAGWNAVLGPGAIGTGSVAFSPVAAPETLAKGVTYVFAVVTTTNTLTTPTPVPTPTPTPAPIALNLQKLQFAGVGSAYAQTLTASEAGYAGLFTLGGTSCNGIAATNTLSDTHSFTITPVAVGTCSYTISGAPGAQATLPVTVTTLSVGGQ